MLFLPMAEGIRGYIYETGLRRLELSRRRATSLRRGTPGGPWFFFDPTAQWPWEPPGLGHREKSVNLFLNHPYISFENSLISCDRCF